MKLSCTVNTGNYCNISIETSEHDNADFAIAEMIKIGEKINHPAVKDFIKVRFA